MPAAFSPASKGLPWSILGDGFPLADEHEVRTMDARQFSAIAVELVQDFGERLADGGFLCIICIASAEQVGEKSGAS